jgi:hypothetical protein
LAIEHLVIWRSESGGLVIESGDLVIGPGCVPVSPARRLGRIRRIAKSPNKSQDHQIDHKITK